MCQLEVQLVKGFMSNGCVKENYPVNQNHGNSKHQKPNLLFDLIWHVFRDVVI